MSAQETEKKDTKLFHILNESISTERSFLSITQDTASFFRTQSQKAKSSTNPSSQQFSEWASILENIATHSESIASHFEHIKYEIEEGKKPSPSLVAHVKTALTKQAEHILRWHLINLFHVSGSITDNLDKAYEQYNARLEPLEADLITASQRLPRQQMLLDNLSKTAQLSSHQEYSEGLFQPLLEHSGQLNKSLNDAQRNMEQYCLQRYTEELSHILIKGKKPENLEPMMDALKGGTGCEGESDGVMDMAELLEATSREGFKRAQKDIHDKANLKNPHELPAAHDIQSPAYKAYHQHLSVALDPPLTGKERNAYFNQDNIFKLMVFTNILATSGADLERYLEHLKEFTQKNNFNIKECPLEKLAELLGDTPESPLPPRENDAPPPYCEKGTTKDPLHTQQEQPSLGSTDIGTPSPLKRKP